MKKTYVLQNGRVAPCEGDDGNVVVFLDPTSEEKHYLVDELKLDEHTLTSALDPDELPRLEFEPQHIAMILKRPRNYSGSDEYDFNVNSLGMFLFKDRLIIVVKETDPFVGDRPITSAQTPLALSLRLIYRTIYHFLEHLKVIRMISDELEDKINASMKNKYLLNLFSLGKSLVYYLNAIHTNGVFIAKVKNNAARIGLDVEQAELLDDIGVENDQCFKLAEIYSNVLSSMMDARVSIVSNNLNVLMKTLTLITIAIMLPTFVVSAFSMNVELPLPQGPARFWIVMCMAAISAAGVLFVWKKKDL